MKVFTGLVILGLVILVGCATDAPEVVAVQGDLTGWTTLPVDAVTVVRQGERHLITVRTQTSTPDWIVRLAPWTYDSSPHILQFDLVGQRNGDVAPSPDLVDITSHTASTDVTIDFTTRWIEICGANGSFLNKVPWLPAASN